MTELAKGQTDGRPIHVGDTVMLRAEVLQSKEGLGAQVRLYSKTDEMKIWVREDHLMYPLIGSDLPEEPEDFTWLLTVDDGGFPLIFHRDDAEGHSDDRRRHDQHWFDVVNQAWIDWPAVVALGAGRTGTRRMKLLPEGPA